MNARRAGVEVTINSKNITREISPYLTGFSYSDILDGESNTAELELLDRDRLWVKDWFPERGDVCSISIYRQDWSAEGLETLDLKNFEIDEVENSYPPNRCKIKLNSIANNSNLRSVDKSRSWEKVKLSKICRDVAEGAGLKLYYDAPDDPEIDRAEQKSESNLSFLHKLCKDKGLSVRVAEDTLIVFDVAKLESAQAVTIFTYGDPRIKSFSGNATISKIYSSAHVVYSHGKKKQKIEHTYSDANKSGGMTLEINKKVSSQAEAERLAKKSLRDKNKEEIKIRLEVLGDFYYLSGNVINFDDTFGFYAGNYIIEKSDFKVGSGFTCSLDLRKCLPY